jgi:hypothetical protein
MAAPPKSAQPLVPTHQVDRNGSLYDGRSGLGRRQPKKNGRSVRQHHLMSLDLITPEASCGLAMRTDDGRPASDRNPEVRMVVRTDGFLKRDKPRANEVGAPNGSTHSPKRQCQKMQFSEFIP